MSTESEWVAGLCSPLWTFPPVNPQQVIRTCGFNQNVYRKDWDLPSENLWAEFQSCPQNFVESALDRICPGRPDLPTPEALIPVMHTDNHASRLFWEIHFLSVRWTDQYHTWTWVSSLKNYVLCVSGVKDVFEDGFSIFFRFFSPCFLSVCRVRLIGWPFKRMTEFIYLTQCFKQFLSLHLFKYLFVSVGSNLHLSVNVGSVK